MTERATAICRLLDAAYGRPDLGNHADPVDELVYILLSTMTTEANYQRSYAALRAALPRWEDVVTAPVEQVEAAIAVGGLAPTKARLIQALIGRLQRDWGGLDLGFMRVWAVSDLRRYLATLPGIGYKAATCVVGYAFGRDVCPVDTHTYRVAVRLGLVPPGTPELGRPAHVAVELSLPAGARLGFHINAVAHGRARCHVARPDCEGCPVAAHCVAPEHGRYSRRGQGEAE
ncbi:DNA lyase [Chloroflexales bacterium ZM16-3]|nr:DNA lyase [Chloroflexales bacterium ZM16-3]